MGRSKHTIHNRLFLLFLSSMTALLLIGSFLYYQKITDIIHGKISDMAEKNISQTAGLFNLLLEGYNSVTKSLNSNYELLRLLQERDKSQNPSLSVIDERTITNIIGAIYFSRDDIVGIHVISRAGKSYHYEPRYAGVVDVDYSSSEWYRKLQDSNGEMVWMGLFRNSVINSFQEDPVFVFGRKLFDLTSQKEQGVVLIETKPGPILAALSNVTISPNSQVYIVDKDSHVIASTDDKKVQTLRFGQLPRPRNGQVLVDNRSDQLIVAANAAMAEWTVYGLTPKGDISAEVDKTRQYLLYVILILVLISTALATLISRNIASPLKLLIREMKQVEMGNFRGSVNVKSFEEINSLVSSFNRMVNRMDDLIDGITSASISEKNAQLQALQSQVNPHFLYNTLDMIYWMLDERENDRLGRVVLALSHMFRYSSDWQEASRTTLEQEIDQMRHYMTIIESRLEGRVHTDIQVDSRWLNVVLPKMTIQPIIENAVKSGLEPLDRPGVLRVYTEVDERELHIVIADNGVGMEEWMLQQIRESLADSGTNRNKDEEEKGKGRAFTVKNAELPDQPTRRGIGLPNVHRRIKLMFGDYYGLRIESQSGIGTTVTIVIPLPGKGGEEWTFS
ncbi:two-component system, sensor histidine kinase YesM [Paenibacillus uliginis N3/975]|uniref:histidine kinase n=1 Tax=Paenibacillus uliginis N3/975 TaxID=1313296 RepID=A0A1X7HUZ8_9BACL|nr:two-component system, sensor histidine kinase YesM [Paenibacillus uliginis N3/975]